MKLQYCHKTHISLVSEFVHSCPKKLRYFNLVKCLINYPNKLCTREPTDFGL